VGTTAAALIDYDNACRTVTPERSPRDVAINLDELLRAVAAQASVLLPGVDELDVRLYGGWADRGGNATPRAGWILQELPGFRTRLNGLRIRPRLATSLLALPEDHLIGTHRSDVESQQKLVDGMLSVDALTLARDGERIIIVVSDDDDFVPAVLVGFLWTPRASPLVLFRRVKPPGDALNDPLLQRRGIRITLC
jgi:hypothetical protein